MAKKSRYRWRNLRSKIEKHNPMEVVKKPDRKPEPMTEKQAEYLKALCFRHGEKFNPSWSKKIASKRIDQLKRRK